MVSLQKKYSCARKSKPAVNAVTRDIYRSRKATFLQWKLVLYNCSVSSSCNDWSDHCRHVSSLVSSCIANLNQRDMAKQLLTPLRLIARMNFSLKNYSCKLFNLTATIGKVELISTFTTAVCKSWNVIDKYT